MRALILAGGYGTRLWPLTKDIPKPMLRVAGKCCLEWIIEHLNLYGINDIIIYTHYKAQIIKNYFKDKVKYDYTPELTGTAQTVYRNRKWLLEKENDFLIVNGDTITNCDISELIKEHQQKRQQVTAFYERIWETGAYIKYAGTMIVNKKGVKYFKECNMIEEIFESRNMGIPRPCPSVLRVANKDWVYFDIGSPNKLDEFEEYIKKQKNNFKLLKQWINP